MNSSLTDAAGLNMNNYFEKLNTSESVTYSEIQFDSKYYDLENLNDHSKLAIIIYNVKVYTYIYIAFQVNLSN